MQMHPGAELPSETIRRLVILGYITAVAMPLIGFVLGIVIATRPRKADSKHGVWIVIVSIIALAIWIVVFTSGVLTSSSNDLTY